MSGTNEVIIIGAGVSGIAAATRLYENGIKKIIILEAENRIGGRIHSVKFDNTIVDIGGQWCHGEENNTAFQMVKHLDLLEKSFNDYRGLTCYLSNGAYINKTITDKLSKIVHEIEEDEEKSKAFSNTSFGEYFINEYRKRVESEFPNNSEVEVISEPLLNWFRIFFMELYALKSWFEVSVKGIQTYHTCKGFQYWHWRNKGYKTIIDVLLRKIPDATKQIPIEDKILLHKVVTSINWDSTNTSNDHVSVECLDGSIYHADHVIVTTSLGVLKNLYKNFVPSLPLYKQTAIEAISYNTLNKILLKFTEKWWPNDFKGFSLLWTEQDRKELRRLFPESVLSDGRSWIETIQGFFLFDGHPNILLGWTVGEAAEHIETLSDNVVEDACMFLLKKFFGQKYNVTKVDEMLRSKWKTNSHFMGSYSSSSLNAEQKGATNEDLAEPVANRAGKQVLFFAGEATHSIYYSTVHGAIETGYREAERIIDIHRPVVHKKVVIIGAGIAGLGAASTLQDNAFDDFLILEAQNRVGGRIHTLIYENQILELGAQWIHGTQNPICELAAKHDLVSEIRSEEGKGLFVRDNGELIDLELVERVDFEIGRILSECEKFCTTNSDYPASVGAFLADQFERHLKSEDSEAVRALKSELFDWHVRFQLVDNSCLDLGKLSAKSWGRYVCDDDEKHINLRCGYQQLAEILANSLPENALRLGAPMARIERDDQAIRVITKNNEAISCEYVIITASLGVLRNSIDLSSVLLPAQSESIAKLGFGAIGKIYLIFEEKWWDFEALQLVWRKDSRVEGEGEGWTRQIQGFDTVINAPRALLGWVGGEGVDVLEGLDEEHVGIHCIKLLKRFLPDRKIPHPVKVVRSSWSSNEWFQGSYSHITPDCDRLDIGMHQLSLPRFLNNGSLGVCLAGEATHPSHYSTVHGAFESGQNQAKNILSCIKKNTQTK